MSPSPAQERAARFIGALRQLHQKQDRGALAALRRGLSLATVRDAWPIIARLGEDIGPDGESASVIIGALFAEHPLDSNNGNLGDTCRSVSRDEKGQLIESFERRFRRLLAADSAADLVGQLRAWIRFAEKKNVAVNYERLLLDLRFWASSADQTRIQWARAFWKSGGETEASNAESPAHPESEAL